MRYISMHKTNKSMEAGEPPSQELMAGMGPLMGEMMAAGVFLSGEGLQPSSKGVRLSFSGGKRAITKGPLTGSNELIDRYLVVQVKSIDEAIEWATRFAPVAADSEIDVRPLTEPWDLGLFPKPAEVTTTRFMIMQKSDKSTEAGVRPSPQRLSAITTLMDEMKGSSVLLSSEALQPSSKGVRLKFSGSNRTVIDGPFTESKELVAGFSILQVSSIDEAVKWASPFARLIGDVEIDIRPLYEG